MRKKTPEKVSRLLAGDGRLSTHQLARLRSKFDSAGYQLPPITGLVRPLPEWVRVLGNLPAEQPVSLEPKPTKRLPISPAGRKPKTALRTPCIHLGEETRQERCASCCGKRIVRIHRCGYPGAEHAECVVSSERWGNLKLEIAKDLSCCQRCPLYEATPSVSGEAGRPEDSGDPTT